MAAAVKNGPIPSIDYSQTPSCPRPSRATQEIAHTQTSLLQLYKDIAYTCPPLLIIDDYKAKLRDLEHAKEELESRLKSTIDNHKRDIDRCEKAIKDRDDRLKLEQGTNRLLTERLRGSGISLPYRWSSPPAIFAETNRCIEERVARLWNIPIIMPLVGEKLAALTVAHDTFSRFAVSFQEIRDRLRWLCWTCGNKFDPDAYGILDMAEPQPLPVLARNLASATTAIHIDQAFNAAENAALHQIIETSSYHASLIHLLCRELQRHHYQLSDLWAPETLYSARKSVFLIQAGLAHLTQLCTVFKEKGYMVEEQLTLLHMVDGSIEEHIPRCRRMALESRVEGERKVAKMLKWMQAAVTRAVTDHLVKDLEVACQEWSKVCEDVRMGLSRAGYPM